MVRTNTISQKYRSLRGFFFRRKVYRNTGDDKVCLYIHMSGSAAKNKNMDNTAIANKTNHVFKGINKKLTIAVV